MIPPKLARGIVCRPSQLTVWAAKWLYADQFEKAETISAPPASTQLRSAASSGSLSAGPSVVQSTSTSSGARSSARRLAMHKLACSVLRVETGGHGARCERSAQGHGVSCSAHSRVPSTS